MLLIESMNFEAIAVCHPRCNKNVASQSGSVWFEGMFLVDFGYFGFQLLYIDIGTFGRAIFQNSKIPSQ